jgi:cell division protein FtsI/penicillin-binding protein 2
MLTYINTIANNGKRLSLSFKKQDNPIISEVNLDKEYMERIQEGFYEVVNSGTGRGYTDKQYNAVGKTGTAESFYQKGITTITQSYIMYAPRDDPRYSIVVVNPNLSYNNSKNNYIAPLNRLISKSISNYLLANY